MIFEGFHIFKNDLPTLFYFFICDLRVIYFPKFVFTHYLNMNLETRYNLGRKILKTTNSCKFRKKGYKIIDRE